MKQVARQERVDVSGDGPVSLRFSPVSDATSQIEISIDYSLADIPSLHYDADFCSVTEGRTGIVVCFGRLDTGTFNLRSKIEISFTKDAFLGSIWKSSRELARTVDKTVVGRRLERVEPPNLLTVEKVQGFRANYTFMAVMAMESTLDFYHLSPGEVHLARTKKKSNILLQPVVRVLCATTLLDELFEASAPFAAQIERDPYHGQ